MLKKPVNSSQLPYYSKKTTSKFIDKEFQVKYMLFVALSMGAAMVLITIPIMYFLNQNYSLYQELAYNYAPKTLGHLERELIQLQTIVLIFLFFMVSFFSYMSYKISSKMIAPIKILQNHLRNLSKGRWYIKPVTIRTNDEFQELVESYNYFFKSFQKHLEQDYQKMLELNISPDEKATYHTWKWLVEQREKQLKKVATNEAILSDEVHVKFRGSDLAS